MRRDRLEGSHNKMIAKGALHLIHNDEELEAYTNALFRLTVLDHPSRAEQDAIELLTLLIERYEEAYYPIPRTDAVSVVRFLLEHRGLTQRDLGSGIRIGKCSLHVPCGTAQTHTGASTKIKQALQTSR